VTITVATNEGNTANAVIAAAMVPLNNATVPRTEIEINIAGA